MGGDELFPLANRANDGSIVRGPAMLNRWRGQDAREKTTDTILTKKV